MPRKRKQVARVHLVAFDLIWPSEKYDVITELAHRNRLSLADMVDKILDDWAARANHALGNTDVPLVLETPEEAKEHAE